MRVLIETGTEEGILQKKLRCCRDPLEIRRLVDRGIPVRCTPLRHIAASELPTAAGARYIRLPHSDSAVMRSSAGEEPSPGLPDAS